MARGDEALSAAGSGAAGPRSRRPLAVLLGVLGGIVVLVGVFFLVDAIVRGVAEERVAEEITAQLPEGVTGTPAVSIGGTSVIAQYLMGSFDDITLTAPDAVIDGVPADITLHATGFPVDAGEPVSALSGTATLSQDALNQVIARTAPNSAVELGDGTVSWAASATVLGFTVGYRVTGELQAAGESVLVTPTDAEVTAGGGSLDLGTLIDRILGSGPISVCTARYLPAGVELADIAVSPGSATVRLEADDIVLDESTLSTLGSCAA